MSTPRLPTPTPTYHSPPRKRPAKSPPSTPPPSKRPYSKSTLGQHPPETPPHTPIPSPSSFTATSPCSTESRHELDGYYVLWPSDADGADLNTLHAIRLELLRHVGVINIMINGLHKNPILDCDMEFWEWLGVQYAKESCR